MSAGGIIPGMHLPGAALGGIDPTDLRAIESLIASGDVPSLQMFAPDEASIHEIGHLQALMGGPPEELSVSVGIEDALSGLLSSESAPSRDTIAAIRNLVADLTTSSEQGAKDVKWGLKNLEWAANNADRASRARFDRTEAAYTELADRQIGRSIKYVARGIGD